MLQATNIVQPDGSSLTNEYYLTGLLARTYGSRSYPVGYEYDAQGLMTTMTNWTAFDPDGAGSGERVTTWEYDPFRGWLLNRCYPDEYGPDYEYKASGRLEKRTWARGNPRVTTTYAYNNAGDLWTVAYANDPAGTQNLAYTYDRRGWRRTVVQGSMTSTFHYNEANQLIGESYSGGTLGGLAMTNHFDAYLRRTSVAAKKSTSLLPLGSRLDILQLGFKFGISDGGTSSASPWMMARQVRASWNSALRFEISNMKPHISKAQAYATQPLTHDPDHETHAGVILAKLAKHYHI